MLSINHAQLYTESRGSKFLPEEETVGTVLARGTLLKISRLVPLLTHTGRRQSVAEQAEADTEKDKRVKAKDESGKLLDRGRNRNTQPKRKTGS